MPMSETQKKAFISASIFACKIGGASVQMAYLGELLAMMENYLLEEVVYKSTDARITKIYARLQKLIFSMMFYRAASMPDKEIKLSKDEVFILQEYMFPIDKSFDTDAIHQGLVDIDALAQIRTARAVFRLCQSEYSIGAQDPRLHSIEFSASANGRLVLIMEIVWNVAAQYDLIQFTAADWKKTYEKSMVQAQPQAQPQITSRA